MNVDGQSPLLYTHLLSITHDPDPPQAPKPFLRLRIRDLCDLFSSQRYCMLKSLFISPQTKTKMTMNGISDNDLSEVCYVAKTNRLLVGSPMERCWALYTFQAAFLLSAMDGEQKCLCQISHNGMTSFIEVRTEVRGSRHGFPAFRREKVARG